MSLAAGEGARGYANNLLKNNIDPKALFIFKDESLTKSGGNVGIREYSDDIGNANRQGATIKMMLDEDVKKLKNDKDLDQVVPIQQINPKYVKFESNDKKYIAPTTYYDPMVLSESKSGSLPNLGTQIKDDEITIPEQFLEKIGYKPKDAIGKNVTITMVQTGSPDVDKPKLQSALISGDEKRVEKLFKPKEKDFIFKIRAVVKKSAMSLAQSPKLNISTRAVSKLNNFALEGSTQKGKYVGVTAIAANNKKPTKVKAKLLKKYKHYSQTAQDAQNLLFTFVNILQGIVAGFGLLALLASVFGIINTQYISVLERVSQIGLMKALGMSGSDIGRLFRYEAAWIGLIGGLVGSILAVGLGILVNPWITDKLSLGEGFYFLQFIWWQIAALLIILILISIVAGWFPSRKAAKLNPVEALRTE